MKKSVRILAAGAACLAALGLSGVVADAASATHYSGCVWNAACLYYSPSQAGSASSWDGAKTSYGSQNFLSAGAGQGQNVANNAASGWDTHASYHLRVYVDTNYGGYSQIMNPLYTSGDTINFNTTLRNDNDSHRFTLS